MDQFEAYFRRADLDGDGRISGAEAVSFFQGSNLPKQVLAQVKITLFNFNFELIIFFLYFMFLSIGSNIVMPCAF